MSQERRRDGRGRASAAFDRAAMRVAWDQPVEPLFRPTSASEHTLALMRLNDEAFLECPYYGARQVMRHLRRLGHQVGRGRNARLMHNMGLAAIYQKPNTSAPHPQRRAHPYLW